MRADGIRPQRTPQTSPTGKTPSQAYIKSIGRLARTCVDTGGRAMMLLLSFRAPPSPRQRWTSPPSILLLEEMEEWRVLRSWRLPSCRVSRPPLTPARFALGLRAVTEHTEVNTTSGITIENRRNTGEKKKISGRETILKRPVRGIDNGVHYTTAVTPCRGKLWPFSLVRNP